MLDTRATTPGMRWLEKQAVVAGGGVSHRAGLHAILIKENHIALACGVSEAVRRAHAAQPDLDVSVGALTHSAPVLDESQLIEGL